MQCNLRTIVGETRPDFSKVGNRVSTADHWTFHVECVSYVKGNTSR